MENTCRICGKEAILQDPVYFQHTCKDHVVFRSMFQTDAYVKFRDIFRDENSDLKNDILKLMVIICCIEDDYKIHRSVFVNAIFLKDKYFEILEYPLNEVKENTCQVCGSPDCVPQGTYSFHKYLCRLHSHFNNLFYLDQIIRFINLYQKDENFRIAFYGLSAAIDAVHTRVEAMEIHPKFMYDLLKDKEIFQSLLL